MVGSGVSGSMTELEGLPASDHRLRNQLRWASALFVLLVVALIVCLAMAPGAGAAGSCGGG